MKRIKISTKYLMQLFQACTADYIKCVCNGRCCESSSKLAVYIHPEETHFREKFKGQFQLDEFDMMIPDARNKCPFKQDDGFCSVNNDKPLACRFSPFALTKNDTLMVMNRYRMLICYKRKEGKIPVYKAHNWSLTQVLGKEQAARVIAELEAGKTDIVADIDDKVYRILKDKHKNLKEFLSKDEKLF